MILFPRLNIETYNLTTNQEKIMSDKKPVIKPIIAAIGTGAVISLASISVANASVDPFEVKPMISGYNLVGDHHADDISAKKDDSKCRCNERNNGDDASDDNASDDDASDASDDYVSDDKGSDGKCGNGQCAASKNGGEGKCGAGKCAGN